MTLGRYKNAIFYKCCYHKAAFGSTSIMVEKKHCNDVVHRNAITSISCSKLKVVEKEYKKVAERK
jgi:uncharacterized protein YijF (DUF1287 family)